MRRKLDRRSVALAAALSLAFCIRAVHAADGASPTQTTLADVDNLLAQKSKDVAAFEKLLGESTSGKDIQARCESTFVLNASVAGANLGAKFTQNLELYRVCRALHESSPGRCDEFPLLNDLNPASKMPGTRRECQDLYFGLIQSKVYMTAAGSPADAVRICSKADGIANEFLRSFVQDRVQAEEQPPIAPHLECEIVSRHADDFAAMMSELSSHLEKFSQNKKASILAEKEEDIRSSLGLESSVACQNKKGNAHQISCMTARAYREAYGKKAPELCGKSGLCRVLMGQGEGSCDVYSDRVKESYCAQPDVRQALLKKRNELSASLVIAQRSLMDMLNLLDAHQPHGQIAIVSRRQKVMALLKRCNGLIKAAQDPSASVKRSARGAPAGN